MIQKLTLGTYTRRISEGIYTIKLDTKKEQLLGLSLAAKAVSPTYLTRSQAGNLYTVTTVNQQGGAGAYDSNNHFLNAVTEEGAPLCYVAVDEKRQLLYGSNYHKGEITVYKILENGELTAASSVRHNDPAGPHKNQDHPHVHYTDLTPDGRLAVCDLGTDRVYTYDVSDNGELAKVAVYKAADATGPRHLVFHPEKPLAYLFGELDSTVIVLAYHPETGVFEELQKISAIPEDFEGENGGAAIRISNDGRFLYASNRGHNSLAVFEIAETGTQIERIQLISTEGDSPRDFDLDPENHFIVCANQNSDNLTLYKRDAKTGKLTLLQKNVYAPECVCVYFEH